MDRGATPSLLPIFRSRQQAELLALLLGDPDVERSLVELAELTGAPYPSVHREVRRAESAGLVIGRLVGRTRLVRADTSSPYYAGLADVLTKAFGVPTVLAETVAGIAGVQAVYVYGSWAARYTGEPGDRPVADVDVLVLGDPDRDALYAAASQAEQRLGREIQLTIRPTSWLSDGTGTFHDTITSRPLVPIKSPRTGPAGPSQGPPPHPPPQPAQSATPNGRRPR